MHAPRGVRAFLAWATITAAMATLALVASPPQASAATTRTTTYTVTSAVWVRSGKSTSGKVLGQLAKGKHVLGAGKATASWVPVKYAGKTAYVSASYLKKDAKAVTKKITTAFSFPIIVKATTEDVIEYSKETLNAKELAAAINEAAAAGKKVTAEPFSCDFTKENFAAKPDLSAPGADDVAEEEFCDNCGRVMVLRNGPWGPFMACPGYNEDPPCKTVRRLNQKQQQKPPEPIDEQCPKCGSQLVKRMGPYGEFISCSAYPKCKYIKQNTIGMKCPKCHDGEIVEKKARRGNLFYGCENYPKCDFTANFKPVDKKCPECGSPYLMEKTLKSGVYLVCPNNKKPAPGEEETKKRKKKGEEESTVACSYTKRIGDAPVEERPTAKTHGPLVEQAV